MGQWVVLNDKERKAKRTVQKHLRKMDHYCYETSLEMEDFLPAYSTSLIIVKQGGVDSYKNSTHINALVNKLDHERDLENYIKYLNMLTEYDPFLREIVEQRVFMNNTFDGIAYRLSIERKQISYLLNKAYLILAFFDKDIDFTINDFYNFYIRNHVKSTCLQVVLNLLIIIKDKQTKEIVKDIAPVFNPLVAEANTLYAARDLLGIKKFLALVYNIAYRHPELDFSEIELKNAVKNLVYQPKK